jgi:hypothetical protein
MTHSPADSRQWSRDGTGHVLGEVHPLRSGSLLAIQRFQLGSPLGRQLLQTTTGGVDQGPALAALGRIEPAQLVVQPGQIRSLSQDVSLDFDELGQIRGLFQPAPSCGLDLGQLRE